MSQEDSHNPWRYYRLWLTAVIVAETVMLIRYHDLVLIYLLIAALFLGGWGLRMLKLYPGQPEPLILDFSGAALAAGFALLAAWLDQSGWRFVLILCSSTIIIPHLIYIYREKS